MKLHFRAPPGTRIEVTEDMIAEAEESIRKIVPPDELAHDQLHVGRCRRRTIWRLCQRTMSAEWTRRF